MLFQPLGFQSSCSVCKTRTQPATHVDEHNTPGGIVFVWAALSQVGVHRVTMSLKGQLVAGSPFTAIVKPACVCASTSVLYGEDHGNSSIRASQTAGLLIQPFDAFGNGVALEDFRCFSVSATGPGDAVVKLQPGGRVSPIPHPNHRACVEHSRVHFCCVVLGTALLLCALGLELGCITIRNALISAWVRSFS